MKEYGEIVITKSIPYFLKNISPVPAVLCIVLLKNSEALVMEISMLVICCRSVLGICVTFLQ